MIVVQHQQYTHHAPESWAECELHDWAGLLPFSRLKEPPTADTVQLACQLWAGIPAKEWRRWQLMPHEWEALQAQFAWIFVPPVGQPFEVLQYERHKLLLPEDNFENSKAIDVAMAFIHFTDFAQDTTQPQALDLLVATLCRPVRADLNAWQKSPDFDGDVREPYNDVRVEARAKAIAHWPLEIKVIVLDYFERMAAVFLDTYGQMFGSSAKEPRYQDGRGWLMMLKNIAREGQFGNFDEVCRQPVHLVYAAALDDVLTLQDQEKQAAEE